ncbi:PIH1 domain-containing protein 1 [Sparganum proliferum]
MDDVPQSVPSSLHEGVFIGSLQVFQLLGQLIAEMLQSKPHLEDDETMIRPVIGVADRFGYQHVPPISPPNGSIFQQPPTSRPGRGLRAPLLTLSSILTFSIKSKKGLENKFKLQLNRDWIVLKNKKCMGTLQEQFIRTKARPAIIEMEPSDNEFSLSTPSGDVPKEPVKPKTTTPSMRLTAVPNPETPEFLVAEINLPEVASSRGLDLEVSHQTISLRTRSNVYELAAELRWPVNKDATVAEFNRDTKASLSVVIV